MTNTPKTFPGVYTQVTDKSFFTPTTSRFKPGLIGVASRGPFNTPTPIRSLKDFVSTFGNPLTTTYLADSSTGLQRPEDGTGYFLADAVDAVSEYTDAITVVRIGNQYSNLLPADAIVSGGDNYTVYSAANAPRVQALLANGPVYLRVTEPGKPSTVNVTVVQAGGGTISIDPTGEPLAAEYASGQIGYDINGGLAANSAEGELFCYTYGTNSGMLADAALTTFGAVTARKNEFTFEVAANAQNIVVGDVFKIMQAGKATTHEVRVASVMIDYSDNSGVVTVEKADLQQIGYQALPMQDNYTAAALYKATGKQAFLRLHAASEGTWANGEGSSQGLYAKVRPGSKPGTKRLEVFWNSALVEAHDNITDDAADTSNYWTVRLKQGVSAYLYAVEGVDAAGQKWTAANTAAPWDSRFYTYVLTAGLPKPMPTGAVNAGLLATSPGVLADTGGQFQKGFNGENPQDTDWIGTLDPVSDKLTGIRAFENKRTVDVNVIAAPMDNISLAVMTQLGRTNARINGFSPADIPAALNGRQAIDWHNGQLLGQSGGKLDSPYVECFWNWCVRTNSWGETKLTPPSVFWLRAAGFVFSKYAPWYAIAGETRGYLPDASLGQFNDVSDDTLQAMQGNGNSVNPILNINGRYFIYGERTMQRLDSKLTAAHSVICVNWVVNGLAKVARRFVFDPNDQELLDDLRLASEEFLGRVENDRGLEYQKLVMDSKNNTATTRNNREVIMDLALIPTDTAERIYLNASVYESGHATVNAIS